MPQKIEMVPGKLTGQQAVVGIVVISCFLVFGLVLAAVVFMETSWSSEPGMAIALSAFLLVWVVACVGLIVFYSRLLSASRTSGSDSLGGIRIEEGSASDGMTQKDQIATRLQNLNKLLADGLISEEEYAIQRAKILQEI